ncbi:putative 30S ribosomal protein S20 [Candidatus Zixiibacteriota bacterium]|nr:putative 30S ribosomal protein S20 [candidate division Zixibacteria bacterium]
MPRHKSCKKRMKTAAQSNIRNRAERSEMKKMVRDLKACKTKAEAQAKMNAVISIIDKSARRDIIHSNKAARDKSRLMALLSKLP